MERTLMKASPAALLALRVWTGVNMALFHGWPKLQSPSRFIENISDRFPVPEVLGWAAIGSELAGGILLALGLWTRPAALLILLTMLGAGFIAHEGDPWKKKEFALTYGMIALFFVVHGAGRLSIDARLRKGTTGGPA
jgi:putative oxidoreductase